MKTILVTGAAGFIGSNLCLELLKGKKNRVVGVDSFLSCNKQNVVLLEKHPNFTFIRHDILKPLLVKKGLDEIYNLACPASPVDYYRFPIETLLVCSQGILNILNLAKRKKAKLLHTSTSEVYGDPLVHPQKEDYWGNVNPIGQRSCYDEGKRFAESLIVNFTQRYQIQTKIVRIFNTYGPMMRADDGRVISNFINQALLGKDITIYGDGQQTRSFCYVDDMVSGLIKMMASSEYGPINLGNPGEFTIKSLAEIVIRQTGTRSRITRKKLPQDDPKQRQPDISLAKNKLGWSPKVQLEEGLKKTIVYFKC